jgi:hypothetical protein
MKLEIIADSEAGKQAVDIRHDGILPTTVRTIVANKTIKMLQN